MNKNIGFIYSGKNNMNIIRRNSKGSDEMNELKEKKVHPKNKDQKWCWMLLCKKTGSKDFRMKKGFSSRRSICKRWEKIKSKKVTKEQKKENKMYIMKYQDKRFQQNTMLKQKYRCSFDSWYWMMLRLCDEILKNCFLNHNSIISLSEKFYKSDLKLYYHFKVIWFKVLIFYQSKQAKVDTL